MKNSRIFILGLCLISIIAYSQAPPFQWVKSFIAPSGSTTNQNIKVDNQGNIIILGTFMGATDFDPGPGTYTLAPLWAGPWGYGESYICKLDAGGNFLWAKTLGSMYGFINHIEIDHSGNIYSTGGVIISSSYDVFVMKMDPSGNTSWFKTFGGGNSENGLNLSVDSLKSIYSTGVFFSSGADFDPGPGTFYLSGNGDAYVCKLDSSGNFLWADAILRTNTFQLTTAWGIANDTIGNTFYGGSFAGTIDCDPGAGIDTLKSLGGMDGFVSKLDASGNLLWAKQIGSPKDDYVNRIKTDKYGNAYITGTFDSIADLDPGPASYTVDGQISGRGFIMKLDAWGNFVWVKTMFYDVSNFNLDPSGNIYTTGSIWGSLSSIDFDPGPASYTIAPTSSWANAFICKLDPAGNFLWAKTLQDTGYSGGGDVVVDLAGNIFSCGSFQGQVDFDPSLSAYPLASSSGTYEAYVHKMGSALTSASAISHETSLSVYPNPSSDKLNILLNKEIPSVTIKLYNLVGLLVRETKFLNTWYFPIDISTLSSGQYIIEIVGDGLREKRKFIKISQ